MGGLTLWRVFSVYHSPKHLFVAQELTQGVVMDDDIKPFDWSEITELDLTTVTTLSTEGLKAIDLDDLKTLDDLPSMPEV